MLIEFRSLKFTPRRQTMQEEIKKEIKRKGLSGKTTKDLGKQLYHKIWSHAKRHDIWPAKFFMDLGIIPTRVHGMNSLDRLDQFMEMFRYRRATWFSIPSEHRLLLKGYLNHSGMSMEIFLLRYGIMMPLPFIYNSLQEIKKDLRRKGLLPARIVEIQAFDQDRTYANIRAFAERQGMLLSDVWTALGITYQEGIVVTINGPERDFVYHNDAQMKKDFATKGLLGSTINKIVEHDGSKTYARVVGYARRTHRPTKELWKILRIRCSLLERIEPRFATLSELKTLVRRLGLVGKTIKEMRVADPTLWREIKAWQEKSDVSFDDIWTSVGLKRTGQRFSSIEEVVDEVRRTKCRSPHELRKKHRTLYKKISAAAKKLETPIRDVWGKAGLVLPRVGRLG